jgi:hypothetical protein
VGGRTSRVAEVRGTVPGTGHWPFGIDLWALLSVHAGICTLPGCIAGGGIVLYETYRWRFGGRGRARRCGCGLRLALVYAV